MKIHIPFIFLLLSLNGISQESAEIVVGDSSKATTIDLGYWQTEKNNLTQAVSSVSATEIESNLYVSPDQIMQGRVAGLTAVRASGQPLGEMTLRIRGVQTLAGGAEPLYVIDGFPIYNDNDLVSSGFTFGPRTNALALLNPADVASVEVLRDAAATAIYGARGANGVVIIRTKKGDYQKSGIELQVYGGMQEAINRYDLLNAQQFAGYVNQASENAGQGTPYNNPGAFGTGTDWQDEIYRNTAYLQNYQIAAQGGTENIGYRLSAAFTDRQGVIKTSDFNRFILHANIDARINDRLKLHNALNISRVESNTVPTDDPGDELGTGVVSGALAFNPILQPLNAEGFFNILNYQADNQGNATAGLQTPTPYVNPVALLSLAESKLENTRFLDVISASYELTDFLTAKATLGLDGVFNEEFTFTSGEFQPGQTIGGVGTHGKLQYYNWFNEYALHLNQTFNDNTLHAMAGFAAQGSQSELLTGRSAGFENETLTFHSLRVGSSKSINSFYQESQLVSWFGHIAYSMKGKYTLALTGRADGSSRFNGDYAFYPAASFAWHASKEDFLKESNMDLKVRVSYGFSGNQEVSPYSTLSVLQQFESPLGTGVTRGFRPITLANDQLEMERTGQFNLGFDLGFMENRLTLSLDLYAKNTDNALVFLPVPAHSGLDVSLANGTEISNKGLDLTLYSKNTEGELTWSTWLNAGLLQNEVSAIDGGLDIPGGVPLQGVEEWTVIRAGADVGSFYGYQTAGLSQNGQEPAFQGQPLQPGDRIYRDQNNDGVINRDDKTVIGAPLPDLSFGMLNRLTYKGFDLSIFLQGVAGNEIANFNKFIVESLDGGANNTQEAYNNTGTAPFHRLVKDDQPNVFSDAYIEDGSFLRLRNITLGYQLPESLTGKLPLSGLRIFITGQNLLTLTGYSGVDPEVSHFGQSVIGQGVDFGGYPLAKSYIGGISIQF